jgi:uncharacterized protein with PIN domain
MASDSSALLAVLLGEADASAIARAIETGSPRLLLAEIERLWGARSGTPEGDQSTFRRS